MRLSELKTGERGVIVRVWGHGGFRKRILEMGFLKGNVVDVMMNAPLRDPIEYKIIGYKISLRREEAKMIEVISEKEAARVSAAEKRRTKPAAAGRPLKPLRSQDEIEEEQDLLVRMKKLADDRRHVIHVALVGNPNCGKTSLFNIASNSHEHTGNYSGVTVDAKEGVFSFRSYKFRIVDLPGTYSLSTYSPEEKFVRHHLTEEAPDVVINVVDSSNLERNLYLTTQLIDMNLRMVVALNMYDELSSRGDQLDYATLGLLLGVPMSPTVSKTGAGIDALFETVINVYENQSPETARHIHINHGAEPEQSIEAVRAAISKNEKLRSKYSMRFLAIKLLENDREAERLADRLPNREEVIATCYQEKQRLLDLLGETSETAIVNAKYGFVQGALKETLQTPASKPAGASLTERIDRIVTHKWLGFPLFFVALYLLFEGTFVLGEYPMQAIEWLVEKLGSFVALTMPEGALKDMVIDGIIGGVGSVIVFLPNILILYAFISFLEDTGYMARAAFIMDRVMHKMGLHGKSFIPLVMGFGCNVPAVMATRTVENHKSRLITMLILPLMSCSARLPVYIVFTGAFFARYASLVMLGLYAFGILLAVLMARFFNRTMTKGDNLPFVMELPPFRLPKTKSITRHTWEKGRQYLRKMGGIIMICSIVIWALGYFPRPDGQPTALASSDSYIETIGKAIQPVLAPLGFDWKMSVGVLSGVGAKELSVSTLGVMYSQDMTLDDEGSQSRLQQALARSATPAAALAYMVFALIYFPCIATIVAIKNESGRWRWALLTVLYTTVLAWLCAFAVFRVATCLCA